ncbi:MAG: 30S ribosomal protein S21 [Phycisphaerae bacterium]|nr:30S ribosomal protein S21 [Phycisphaerae bacterium]
MAIKVKARGGESVEQMVRRFKKLCEKEGLTKEVKRRQYYEKPSETKRRDAARRAPRPAMAAGRPGARPSTRAGAAAPRSGGGRTGGAGRTTGGRSGGGRPAGARGPSRG